MNECSLMIAQSVVPILFVAHLNHTEFRLRKALARFPDLIPMVHMSQFHQPAIRIAGLRVSFAYFGWYCLIGLFYLYNVVAILN